MKQQEGSQQDNSDTTSGVNKHEEIKDEVKSENAHMEALDREQQIKTNHHHLNKKRERK